jgi:hypothetical protein
VHHPREGTAHIKQRTELSHALHDLLSEWHVCVCVCVCVFVCVCVRVCVVYDTVCLSVHTDEKG